MHNNKFEQDFINFINKNFNKDEHIFLVRKLLDDIKVPEGENVIIVDRFYKHLHLLYSAKKIICHGLFDGQVVALFYELNKLLNKAYWVIWGGDLYGAPMDKYNRYVKANFKGYFVLAHAEEKVVKEQCQVANDNFKLVQYIIPTNLEQLANAKKERKASKTIKIQINNSACESTLEVLNILAKYKDEDIVITTVLSYGHTVYNEQIIQTGKNIFGNKFEYLDKLISTKDYAAHLASIDIMIFNQNRQQGLGNIFAALILGTKMYIKDNISTSLMLKDYGIRTNDTRQIVDMEYAKFIENNDAEYNSEKALIFFNEEHQKRIWETALNA